MNLNKMKKMIEKFENASILVIGDLMLDRYLSGTMSRISPEAPTPLIDIDSEYFQLGGAANAINTICCLGGKVLSVGVVGDDWFGKHLIYLLKQEEVNTSGIIEIKDRSTTVKTRILVGEQQIIRFDRENRDVVNEEFSQSIMNYVRNNIEYVDGIVISDYNKGVVTNELLNETINLARKFEKPIIVYPKVEDFLEYNGVTIVITDLEKASSFTGIRYINETSMRNMGQWLLTHLECEFVLIINGKDGMSLFERSGGVTHVPPNVTEAHNKTGTIDIIAGLIGLSLASDISSIYDSMFLASIAAGFVLNKPKRIAMSRDELKQQVSKNSQLSMNNS